MYGRLIFFATCVLSLLVACGGGAGDGDDVEAYGLFGVSEDVFLGQFANRLCDEYTTCNPDITCDVDDSAESAIYAACTYDPESAAECLAGDYTCDESFGDGFEFVVVPEACGRVYLDCGQTTTNTATTYTTY